MNQPATPLPKPPVAAAPKRPKLIDAVSPVYDALSPLEPQEQRRVIGAVCQLLGLDIDFLPDEEDDDDEGANSKQ
jgi:hypothetical protein